jgi:transmembrane sensor
MPLTKISPRPKNESIQEFTSMMAATDATNSALKETVANWLVRIDSDDMSATEIAEFERWLNEDPAHKANFYKLAKLWDSLAIVEVLAEYYPTPLRTTDANHTRGDSLLKKLFSPTALGAYAMAGCALILALTLGISPKEIEHFQTKPGQRMEYQLSDGSRVMLNTDTSISFDFRDNLRILNLIKGEAHFSVAKDKTHPFVVNAGGGLVWAVGTVFNVRYTTPDVSVVVTEGTVKVLADTSVADAEFDTQIHTAAQNTQALVSAGNAVTFRKVVSALAPLNERQLAWIDGSLVFKGETLAEAVSEISRYTNYRIIIADDSLKTLQIGGHYNTGDVDAMLFTLGKTFGITATKTIDNTILLTKQ